MLKRAVIFLAMLAVTARAQTNFTPGRYWCDTQDVTKAASQHKFNQWYQAESLRKEIVSRVVSNALDMSATNLTPVWEVVSTTNIATSYIICTGTVYDATNGAVRYDVTPAGANLTPGNYRGYSRLLQTVGGTNINIAVLQYQDIQVLESPDSENYGMVGPITPTSYVQNVIDGGTSGSVGVITRSGANVTIVFPEPLAGSGDMLKSVYDVNTNGVVDDAAALGGTAAAAYATDAELAAATNGLHTDITNEAAARAAADTSIQGTHSSATAALWTAIGTKIGSSGVTFENADANGDVGTDTNQFARGSAVTTQAVMRATADTALATTQSAIRVIAEAGTNRVGALEVRLLAMTNNFTFAGTTVTNPCGVSIAMIYSGAASMQVTGCMAYLNIPDTNGPAASYSVVYNGATYSGSAIVFATGGSITNVILTNGQVVVQSKDDTGGGSGGGGAYVYQGTNNIAPTNHANTFGLADIGETIGGGASHIVTNANYATVNGGQANTIASAATHSTIGGGNGNDIGANSTNATVGGGQNNDVGIATIGAAILGGQNNSIGASSHSSTIGGGTGNVVSNAATSAFIGGGVTNRNGASSGGVIGGGSFNILSSPRDTLIAGGYGNIIGYPSGSGAYGSTIVGGEFNVIGETANGAIAGGYSCQVRGNSVVSVALGDSCIISNARGSVALGELARVDHPHSFVFNDNYTNELHTTAAAQFLIKAAGGVGIKTNAPNGALDVAGIITVGGARTNDPAAYGLPQLYSKVVGTTNELFVMDAAGNVTQLSSHDGLTHVAHSYNVWSGEGRKINLDALAEAVEKLTGRTDIVQRVTLPRRVWSEIEQEKVVESEKALADYEAELPAMLAAKAVRDAEIAASTNKLDRLAPITISAPPEVYTPKPEPENVREIRVKAEAKLEKEAAEPVLDEILQ